MKIKLIIRILLCSLLIILTEKIYCNLSPSSYSMFIHIYLPSLLILLLLFAFNYVGNRVEIFSVSFHLTMISTLIGTVFAFVCNVITDDSVVSLMPGEIKSQGWDFLITIVVFAALLFLWLIIYILNKLINE